MTMTVVAVALLYVVFGIEGLEQLRPDAGPWDPDGLCMVLYGLSAVVMMVVGVRNHLRFERNGAALLSTDARVVIASDRWRSLLFGVALALAEPQLVRMGFVAPRGYGWIIMALILAFFAVKALMKAAKPLTLAIIDSDGIEAPENWQGRIRWQDLQEIRTDRAETSARLTLRMQCLAFVFNESVSPPQRIAPSASFDAHLSLGIFMMMPSWIGLSLADAVDGFNARLERSRAAP
jgi:hypothetical protein